MQMRVSGVPGESALLRRLVGPLDALGRRDGVIRMGRVGSVGDAGAVGGFGAYAGDGVPDWNEIHLHARWRDQGGLTGHPEGRQGSVDTGPGVRPALDLTSNSISRS